jgi:hypothetical protein
MYTTQEVLLRASAAPRPLLPHLTRPYVRQARPKDTQGSRGGRKRTIKRNQKLHGYPSVSESRHQRRPDVIACPVALSPHSDSHTMPQILSD